MLGYSGTNATGVIIVNSTWDNNRAGIVPNSLSSEELAPQGQATIAGNKVRSNNNLDAPDSESFGIAFGNGIIVAGGVENRVERNLVEDHEIAGIAVVFFLDDENTYPAMGNQVIANDVSGSGVADLALQASFDTVNIADDPNCFADNTFSTSAPSDIEAVAPCEGEGIEPTDQLDLAEYLDADYPEGPSYQDVPAPPDQPNMPDAETAPPRPATDVPMKIDVDAIETPKP